MKKVLVLEDEASIRSFIVINLQRAGYEVVEAECGEEALQKLQENPDTKLCLLDIMLPDIDGFEVCRRIRMSNAQVGIIMLTARTQEMDKVTGLMTGADDYVTSATSRRSAEFTRLKKCAVERHLSPTTASMCCPWLRPARLAVLFPSLSSRCQALMVHAAAMMMEKMVQ